MFVDPPHPVMSRRSLWSLGIAALAYAAGSRRALAGPVASIVERGLHAMCELATELRAGHVSPTAWQDQMSDLVASLDAAELAEAIELSRLAAELSPLPDDRARVRELRFDALGRALADAGVRTKLFALGPGRAIVPHGHQGMVSMHWVLRGAMHGRHFDRVATTARDVLIRPTIDRVLRAGDASSISEHRDNIHWFVAMEGPAYAFDVIVSHLDPQRPHGRVYLDPRAATPEGDVLRAPRLSPAQARRRYGRG